LDDAGVGRALAADATEDDLRARDQYRRTVEAVFQAKASEAHDAGRLRTSCIALSEGRSLCPWSDELSRLAMEQSESIRKIDTAESTWRQAAIPKEPLHARDLLLALAPYRGSLTDSPDASRAGDDATQLLLDYWNSRVVRLLTQDDKSWAEQLASDGALSFVSEGERSTVAALGHAVAVLPPSITPTVREDQVLRILGPMPSGLAATQTARVLPLSDSIGSLVAPLSNALEDWAHRDLSTLLTNGPASHAVINSAEELVRDTDNDSRRVCLDVAVLHLRRASVLAKADRQAALGLLHIARARQLGAPEDDCRAPEALALASLAAAKRIIPRLAIDLATTIDPKIVPLLELAVETELAARTRPGIKWRIVDPVLDDPDVRVTLESAELLVAKFADLSEIPSRYLSHYEDVPNPEKARLETSINLAKISLSLSESSYHSAVSSHNMHPTQYSLNNVNSAYNSYASAVDSHNALVRRYNRTPDTISQPVFLPYTFREGTLLQGWRLRGSVSVGKANAPFSIDKTESDFVRLDARNNDATPDHRKNDRLSLDTSTGHLVALMTAALDDLCRAARAPLTDVITFPRGEMTDAESGVARWLNHPFGIMSDFGRELGVPRWALGASDRVVLPTERLVPPPIDLARRSDSTSSRPERNIRSSEARPLVCELVSHTGASAIRGTGALVSADGLILTCAHVLRGSKTVAHFRSGPLEGEYSTDAVFVDDTMDVAIIRASNLHSDNWIPIRLDSEPTPGEAVFAISNPAIGTYGHAEGALSEGIVSASELVGSAAPRLVANIAVASGSSGGPLVSASTGEIVGIALAVAEPGVDREGVSSTGFFCVAAPSVKLTEWLGLRYVDLVTSRPR